MFLRESGGIDLAISILGNSKRLQRPRFAARNSQKNTAQRGRCTPRIKGLTYQPERTLKRQDAHRL